MKTGFRVASVLFRHASALFRPKFRSISFRVFPMHCGRCCACCAAAILFDGGTDNVNVWMAGILVPVTMVRLFIETDPFRATTGIASNLSSLRFSAELKLSDTCRGFVVALPLHGQKRSTPSPFQSALDHVQDRLVFNAAIWIVACQLYYRPTARWGFRRFNSTNGVCLPYPTLISC